jgi:hypothetical protein
MADSTLTNLGAADPLASADLVYVVQGGVSKRATVAQVTTAVTGTAGTGTGYFWRDTLTANQDSPLDTADNTMFTVEVLTDFGALTNRSVIEIEFKTTGVGTGNKTAKVYGVIGGVETLLTSTASTVQPLQHTSIRLEGRDAATDVVVGHSPNIGPYGSGASGGSAPTTVNYNLALVEQIRVKFTKATGTDTWILMSWGVRVQNPGRIGGGGSVSDWGDIGGTITDQTDLVSYVRPSIDTETAGRALVAADVRIAYNNTVTGNFTIATGESIDEIVFYQIGTGAIEITAASGVTINGVDADTVTITNVKYTPAVLTRLSANTYMVS